MRVFFTALVAAALVLTLDGCSLIYKLPTRQGNVIDQKQIDQLQVGMTRDQVRFLMGTPVATSPFRDDRWDYVGYYRSPRGAVTDRVVSLYFSSDKLSRMEGTTPPADSAQASALDAQTLLENKKKADLDKERADVERQTGGVVTRPGPAAQDPAAMPNP